MVDYLFQKESNGTAYSTLKSRAYTLAVKFNIIYITTIFDVIYLQSSGTTLNIVDYPHENA